MDTSDKYKGLRVLNFIQTQALGFAAGNVVKYVSRYRNVEDLHKAKAYLEYLIKFEEEKLNK